MVANTLREAVDETDGFLPYDAACKRILSEREILARIMHECLPEYKDCDVADIATRYIKDEPLVDVVPLRPAPRVGGLRNDDVAIGEGRVTYDIRFSAEAPGVDGTIGLVVNVEAQGDADRGRRLLARAVYYCARMLSAQYGEVFSHGCYEDLRKVYSIWICPHPPKGQENTIVRYSMAREVLAGDPGEDPGFADLLSVVVVGLGTPGSAGYTGVLDLLATLFSKELPGADKLRVLADDYGIALTDELEGGVALMGSFGVHIYREAREAGLAAGRAEGLAEGLAEGATQATATALAHLMASTGWDAERAMDALSIPEGERAAYRERLAAPAVEV